MTAGRGITHSERFERPRAEGGTLHGIQAWVALPDGARGDRPRLRTTTAPPTCRPTRPAGCGRG